MCPRVLCRDEKCHFIIILNIFIFHVLLRISDFFLSFFLSFFPFFLFTILSFPSFHFLSFPFLLFLFFCFYSFFLIIYGPFYCVWSHSFDINLCFNIGGDAVVTSIVHLYYQDWLFISISFGAFPNFWSILSFFVTNWQD